jgi:uncharacterized phage protein (TIGR01671 family)
MREILFRGKRTDDGEWLYGNLTIWSDKTASIDNEPTEASPLYAVDPETVGQYTGLTDKNGKKIFEGDIVKDFIPFNFTLNGQKLYKENTYIVEYSNKKCGFSPFCEEDYDGIPIIEECVVIDNIHDNPELLKGGAEE